MDARQIQVGLRHLLGGARGAHLASGCRGAGVAGEELTAIGWINGDGSPLTGAEAAAATSGTHAALRRLGALPASPDGVAFARAALSTWPGTA